MHRSKNYDCDITPTLEIYHLVPTHCPFCILHMTRHHVPTVVISKHSAVHGLGLAMKLIAKIFQSERPLQFQVPKSMTKEARREERKLSCTFKHWHHVPSETGNSFTCHESWMPWGWWLPLNWAPSPSLAFLVSIPVEGK